jgi:hypothetical protein
VSALRRFYGAQPLHLLASVACLALIVAACVHWLGPGSDPSGVITWFAGCLLGSQLVLVPVAWGLDRLAWGRGASARTISAAYLWVPALFSGLLLILFLPLILQLNKDTFIASTGIVPSGYLYRWLYATAVLFGGSALLCAVRLARARWAGGAPRP